MADSSLGDAVHDGAVLADVGDCRAGGGGDDDYARGVLSRACLFEQRRESAGAVVSSSRHGPASTYIYSQSRKIEQASHV